MEKILKTALCLFLAAGIGFFLGRASAYPKESEKVEESLEAESSEDIRDYGKEASRNR
jgi:hypothetical protein